MAVATIVPLFGGLISAFTIAGLWIWKHTTSLNNEDDLDKVEELEDDHWSTVSSELGSLYVDVEENLQDSEEADEISHEDHIVEVIERDVDPEELEIFVEELTKVGDIDDLYRKHAEYYKECYKNCFYVSGLSLCLGIVVSMNTFSTTNPDYLLIIGIVLAGVALDRVREAWTNLRKAKTLKEEFEEKWANYRNTIPKIDIES